MQHQEAWPLNPGWHQQEGLIIRARERHAMRPRDAMTLPFANRQLPAAIGEHEIEIRRHHDLVAPGLPGTPSDIFQVVGGQAMRSGTESTTSRRPSRSKSTA